MDENLADFWEHVEELRKTLIRSVSVVAIGFLLFLIFYKPILHLLAPYPAQRSTSGLTRKKVERIQITNQSAKTATFELPEGATLLSGSAPITKIEEKKTYLVSPGETLFYEEILDPSFLILGPIEGVSLVLKICFWLSLASTAPVWGWLWLQFILPGLRKEERVALFPFLVLSIVCLATGMILAYTITLPLANQYLLSFNHSIGHNAWTLTHYIDYLLLLCLGHAVAAELALLLFILVHFRLISAEELIRKRRLMIVVAFILGALLTPPDVLTQLLLAIPLTILYEAAIYYAKKRRKPPPKMS